MKTAITQAKTLIQTLFTQFEKFPYSLLALLARFSIGGFWPVYRLAACFGCQAKPKSPAFIWLRAPLTSSATSTISL